MKYLKKFNEELSPKEQDSLENAFIKAKISPQTSKVNIKSIYSVLFIQVDGYVENVDGKGRYMMIDLNYVCNTGSYISVHETLDYAAAKVIVPDVVVSDNWEQFKSHHSDRLVSILEYNDINFQQIENILLDYNINVENMWGLIR